MQPSAALLVLCSAGLCHAYSSSRVRPPPPHFHNLVIAGTRPPAPAQSRRRPTLASLVTSLAAPLLGTVQRQYWAVFGSQHAGDTEAADRQTCEPCLTVFGCRYYYRFLWIIDSQRKLRCCYNLL